MTARAKTKVIRLGLGVSTGATGYGEGAGERVGSLLEHGERDQP